MPRSSSIPGFFCFFTECLSFPENEITTAIKIPLSTDKNITIAKDASNLQKRKDTATGEAFCTEKIVTSAMIASKGTIIIIFSSFSPSLKVCSFHATGLHAINLYLLSSPTAFLILTRISGMAEVTLSQLAIRGTPSGSSVIISAAFFMALVNVSTARLS